MRRIYLDWAATAPPFPDIAEGAMKIALEDFGNPSSAHAEGKAAATILESSRVRVANALGVPRDSVVFTSGGTESNNIILSSLLAQTNGGEVVVSGIEHASVYEPAEQLASLGYRVKWVRADADGRIAPGRVLDALSERTLLVAVMHVNNETGAIQPIGEITRAIRGFQEARGSGRPIHIHCDAVQAVGKIEASYAAYDVDSVSLSGHKIGGLRGAGALIVRKPMAVLFRGGGQEANLRPGTENLPAIWALAEAVSRGTEQIGVHRTHATAIRSRLVEGIAAIEGARFVPDSAATGGDGFSPYILSAAFPPLPGEVLVRALNDAGCSISTGSACSSKRAKGRRVLTNMGVDAKLAQAAVRISTGFETSEEDIERFLELLKKEVHKWSTPLRA